MPTDPQLFELRALQAMLHGLIRVRMMQFNADSNLELPDLVTMFAGKQAASVNASSAFGGSFQADSA